jgi:chaperonin GroEL (HSP60 family)
VRRACEEPVRQIVLNCGTEGAVVVEKIKNHAIPTTDSTLPRSSTKTW